MLDIANIGVAPQFRGRGWFTAFRRIAEAIQPWDGTYYESVGNPRLQTHFQRAGVIEDGEHNYYALKR
jgi:hypothetical protein